VSGKTGASVAKRNFENKGKKD